MANTIPVTQKPVPSSVSKDAYVLGIQDNGSGQQALYRLPINDVRGNGANDLFIIPSLITQLGVKNALKAFVEANADYDSLTNICNRFFAAAAKSVTGTYTSQFYKYESSNSPIGEKQDANAELTCTPSTKAAAGTDDYATLPLFACFDVNYTIDGTTLEPVILAIKGVYGSFSSAPAASLVGVMQMTGWVRRTSTDTTKKVEYRATEETGFKRLVARYGGAHGIAVEITDRIKARDLALPPIHYRDRIDKSSGKLRRLGIESAMQQCMNYVAVYALMPMLKAKVGAFQCASIPERGQVYGKKVLEKWIRKDPKGTKYYDKMDVRHCFQSIGHRTIRKLLERDIHKNKTLIWFVLALVGTYEEGLSIGSFLSQWLCNYVMSYAYHYATENLYKERRGKRQNLITHILIFMDDVIIFAASKRNAKAAGKALEEFMLVRLGLCIKPNRCIKQTANEPPDMMGYVISKERTTIRARTFVRARRALLRAWRRMCAGLPLYLQNARRIVSYRGYFKHTNSNKIAKALHLKAVHRAARKVISKFAKGANNNGNESVLHRTPGQYQVYEPALG